MAPDHLTAESPGGERPFARGSRAAALWHWKRHYTAESPGGERPFARGSRAAALWHWKRHYSLYPATARLLAAFQEELAAYVIVKSTIRFPLSEPVPAKLIGRIAKFRAHEVAGRAKRKAAESKKR